MRKIKEVLRLKWESGLSNRAIAASCAIGETTVRQYTPTASTPMSHCSTSRPTHHE